MCAILCLFSSTFFFSLSALCYIGREKKGSSDKLAWLASPNPHRLVRKEWTVYFIFFNLRHWPRFFVKYTRAGHFFSLSVNSPHLLPPPSPLPPHSLTLTRIRDLSKRTEPLLAPVVGYESGLRLIDGEHEPFFSFLILSPHGWMLSRITPRQWEQQPAQVTLRWMLLFSCAALYVSKLNI